MTKKKSQLEKEVHPFPFTSYGVYKDEEKNEFVLVSIDFDKDSIDDEMKELRRSNHIGSIIEGLKTMMANQIFRKIQQ